MTRLLYVAAIVVAVLVGCYVGPGVASTHHLTQWGGDFYQCIGGNTSTWTPCTGLLCFDDRRVIPPGNIVYWEYIPYPPYQCEGAVICDSRLDVDWTDNCYPGG